MKKVIKILCCIVMALIIQFAVLWYFESVILRESEEFSIENVEVLSSDSNEINGEIAPNAKDIQGSYNGNYIMYFIDDKLFLVNTKTGQTKNILKDTDILSVKWVPNNNTIFIVENRNNKINIKTLNASNECIQDICELCEYEENFTIQEFISMAAQYVIVKKDNMSTIYRINIDKEVKVIEDNIKEIDSAIALWNKDMFYYKDSITNNLYKYTNNNTLKINTITNMKLLKVTSDKIYLGECCKENVISKIIYGSHNEDVSTWKTIDVDNGNLNDIYISDNEEIFINNNLTHFVRDPLNDKEIKYEGYFAFMNDNVICSVENGKICYKIIQ